jgi:hypothetical protein
MRPPEVVGVGQQSVADDHVERPLARRISEIAFEQSHPARVDRRTQAERHRVCGARKDTHLMTLRAEDRRDLAVPSSHIEDARALRIGEEVEGDVALNVEHPHADRGSEALRITLGCGLDIGVFGGRGHG